MTDLSQTPAEPGDPIQLTPAWQRGYDARMWGVVLNKEVGFCARFAYEAGVRAAARDELNDLCGDHDDDFVMRSDEPFTDWEND
jgi:hypothetical protein